MNSSEGCIITDLATRRAIDRSRDSRLVELPPVFQTPSLGVLVRPGTYAPNGGVS